MSGITKKSLNQASLTTVDMYDRIPGVFAGHFANFRSMVPDVELAHKLAGTALGESRLVEIGCGDGRDAETAFVPAAGEYTGYDPSKGLLELARARFPGARPDMFREGYAQTTDYPSDTDVMMSVNSILHVPTNDLKDVFERAYEGLRPGGVLFAITKVEEEDNTEVYHDDFDGTIGERYFYHHSVSTMGKYATAAGLKVIYKEITPVETKPWDWLQFCAAKV